MYTEWNVLVPNQTNVIIQLNKNNGRLTTDGAETALQHARGERNNDVPNDRLNTSSCRSVAGGFTHPSDRCEDCA